MFGSVCHLHILQPSISSKETEIVLGIWSTLMCLAITSVCLFSSTFLPFFFCFYMKSEHIFVSAVNGFPHSSWRPQVRWPSKTITDGNMGRAWKNKKQLSFTNAISFATDLATFLTFCCIGQVLLNVTGSVHMGWPYSAQTLGKLLTFKFFVLLYPQIVTYSNYFPVLGMGL